LRKEENNLNGKATSRPNKEKDKKMKESKLAKAVKIALIKEYVESGYEKNSIQFLLSTYDIDSFLLNDFKKTITSQLVTIQKTAFGWTPAEKTGA
jgi:hypothetical protein